jgi:hypothetical protein
MLKGVLFMSQDQNTMAGGDAAPYVQLFQKAHQRIVMLERLEEQVQQILGKRQELQDELRSIQAQLNEEFDSRIRTGPAGIGADVRPSVTITADARRGRFAGQAIDAVGQVERAVVG